LKPGSLQHEGSGLKTEYFSEKPSKPGTWERKTVSIEDRDGKQSVTGFFEKGALEKFKTDLRAKDSTVKITDKAAPEAGKAQAREPAKATEGGVREAKGGYKPPQAGLAELGKGGVRRQEGILKGPEWEKKVNQGLETAKLSPRRALTDPDSNEKLSVGDINRHTQPVEGLKVRGINLGKAREVAGGEEALRGKALPEGWKEINVAGIGRLIINPQQADALIRGLSK
jgi:hypothetical protein